MDKEFETINNIFKNNNKNKSVKNVIKNNIKIFINGNLIQSYLKAIDNKNKEKIKFLYNEKYKNIVKKILFLEYIRKMN